MSEPANPDLICRIDASNTIVAAGRGWSYLLHDHPPSDGTPPPYIGKRLWNHLRDSAVVHLCEALVAKVRRTAEDLAVPFRCDQPGRRLHLEMRVCRLPAGGIEFRSLLLREEPKEPVTTFRTPPQYSGEFIRICGWCKRIASPEWLEVDDAIRRLKLLESDEMMRVTHSICPECAEKVIQEMRNS